VIAAGDERGSVGCEEGNERGDLVRGTEPTEGVLAREERLGLIGEVCVDERRGDEAGAYSVDPNALGGVLERCVFGQADQAAPSEAVSNRT
jgi:hypothetical protein